ncbi:MAG: hypothetical protein Q7S88_03115, partial [Candidatus Daviesbacteria bacterium]|nr:hypothetical protein [Candidatus Daviesbacteria bacterium]
DMLKTAKVVGLNSDQEAALALIRTFDLESRTNSFFIIIYTSVEDAFTKIRQTLAEVEELFLDSEKSPAEKLDEILSFLKNSLKEAEDLEILVASLQLEGAKRVFYLLGLGEKISALLFRDAKRINLRQVGQGEALVSGFLEPGDRVVLLTDTVEEVFNPNLEALHQVKIEEFEDEVLSKLPQGEIFPAAAIVFEEELAEIPREVLDDSPKAQFLRPRVLPILKIGFSKVWEKVKLLKPRSRRSWGVLVGIVIMALLFGAFSLTRLQKTRLEHDRLTGYIETARSEYNNAQGLKDSSPAQAGESLEKSKAALASVLALDTKNTEALDLQKQIEENSWKILKIHQLQDIPLWLDLSLIKKDFTSDRLSFSVGRILLLNSDGSSLVVISESTKSHQILAGKEKLGESTHSSLNGEVAWIFSKDKGVIKIDTTTDKSLETIKVDDEWGGIVDIYGFGGNLYLLDSGNPPAGGQIWKYLPIVTGYSDKKAYLVGEKEDLIGSKRMQIDGSVWVLNGKGEIVKYTQGVKDHFSISGMDKPISKIKTFYVSDTTEKLYIIDEDNSRLVVLDKSGVYKTQYQSEKLKEVTDLIVEEKSKKVYLLLGNKILQIDLKD